MKKVSIISLLVLAVTHLAAQDRFKMERYGLKAGVQMSSFSVGKGDLPKTLAPSVGLQFGAFATLGLTDRLAVQPELHYSLQGYRYEGDKVNQDYRYVFTHHYLKVPIMLRYSITDRFAAEVGPQVAFLVAAKLLEEDQGEEVYNGSVYGEFRKVDFAAAAGLEYGVTEQVGVNLRFAHSFTALFSGSMNHERPWVLSLGVNYSF